MKQPLNSERCAAIVPDVRGERRCTFRASNGRLCGIHYNSEVDNGPVRTVDHDDGELANLRAYKKRTEWALRELCNNVTINLRGKSENSDFAFALRGIRYTLATRGLWREGGA